MDYELLDGAKNESLLYKKIYNMSFLDQTSKNKLYNYFSKINFLDESSKIEFIESIYTVRLLQDFIEDMDFDTPESLINDYIDIIDTAMKKLEQE